MGRRRKEGRKERGGNYAEREATAFPDSVKWIQEPEGTLKGGGTSRQVATFSLDLGENKLLLDKYHQISPARGGGRFNSRNLYFQSCFFLQSCHVWDSACDGLSDHHPPTDYAQLLLGVDEPKSCRSCLCLSASVSTSTVSVVPTPSADRRAAQHAGLTSEKWHRLCLRARRWSTCLSGTAGSTGSGGSSSASGERKRSFSR